MQGVEFTEGCGVDLCSQEVCQASIWRNGDQPRVSCRAALRDGLGCCGVRETLEFFLGVGFEVVGMLCSMICLVKAAGKDSSFLGTTGAIRSKFSGEN